MNKYTLIYLTISVFALFSDSSAFGQERGYFSSPVAHDNVLVFSSEGDLWRTNVSGGAAMRLTTHPEVESDPTISPDGRYLAFSANYDGGREVYVVPLEGGAPVQLTFEGGGVRAVGWTRDGHVLFSSANEPGVQRRVLRTVNPTTMESLTLPLHSAVTASYQADGKTVFFSRFGLSISGDNAVLYRGGLMAQLWRHDLDSDAEAVRLADEFGAPIRSPMWWDERIYFISDKSGSDNIWSVDELGEDARRHTTFVDWQIRTPSLSRGKIFYQRGADLFVFDLERETETAIDVKLTSDRDFTRTRWLENPLSYLDAAHIGADGKAVVLTARGNVAIAYTGSQRRVELAIPEAARAREAVISADGKWVYMIIDQDQSGEIWRFTSDGRGNGQKLTEQSDAHIWDLHISPDGKRILFDDKQGRLWSLDVNSRRKTLLETNNSGDDSPFSDVSWSSEGRYVAYTARNKRSLREVIIRDFSKDIRKSVSGSKYESFAPTFTPKGDWLYFISNRNFAASPSSPWGDRNTGPGFNRRGKVYAIQLTPDVRFPFAPGNELSTDRKPQDRAEDNKKGKNKSKAPSKFVFDGIEERLWEVPVRPDNYVDLQAGERFLYGLVRRMDENILKSIQISSVSPDVSNFTGNIARFELSSNRKRIFYRTTGPRPTLAIVPAGKSAPEKLGPHIVRIDDWRLAINIKAEWRQLFLDAWRLHRDFAFDRDLRGVDWEAVRDKYWPLVERIGHRSELNDLLRQMIAEIGILHSQVRATDLPNDNEKGVDSFLGAKFTSSNAGLVVDLIYDGERDLPEQLGPLLKPGVDVRKGDILVAIDGRQVQTHKDMYTALQHKANQEVLLDLKRGRRSVSAIVKPANSQAIRRLRYRHWVEKNRQYVHSASDNNFGYLHLRAMGRNDIASFVRDFYQHVDKDGLVIDVRGNSGGNIDSFIIATLLRKVWAFWESDLGGDPSLNMQRSFRGHLAVIINEGTYSDGETFAAGIKALGLGYLIGTRTAGAGIWLSDRNRLADNGIARIAESAQSRLDGQWLIEGRGISPDVVVENMPFTSFQGQDAQLDAALDYLREKVAADPIPKLKADPLPPLGQYGSDIN